MLSQFHMNLNAFFVLAAKVWTCLCFIFNRQVRAVSAVAKWTSRRKVNNVKMSIWFLSGRDPVVLLQFAQYQPVKYDLFPLSPVSRHRLGMVQRKTLVLDLDETLIHSHHDAMPRNTVKPGTPHDFTVKVTIDRHPVRFFVHKRPHVDFFLDVVSGVIYSFPCRELPQLVKITTPLSLFLSLSPRCRFRNGTI